MDKILRIIDEMIWALTKKAQGKLYPSMYDHKIEILLKLKEKVSRVGLPVMQKPKPKTLQAIFEIVDNIDFELARLEDIAKGEIGDEITLLRKYIDENRVSA